MVTELTATTVCWELVAIIAAAAGLLTLLAELLHQRRIRRISGLAFGPSQQPTIAARVAPWIRVVATSGLAAALLVLAMSEPMSHRKDGGTVPFEKLKHVLIVLDVSPSMRLEDAGMKNDVSRMKRAREVMESYFQRIPMSEFRVTVIAVYTDAFPVVEDTKDAAVVRNILNDLPMHYAFVPGETNLFAGIETAAEVARGWRPRSATMVMVTDGDTVPATGMPRLPASIADVLIVGIGDAKKGSFINGKNSRQDVSTLRQIAARLGGTYHNGNEKHLSTALIEKLTTQMEGESKTQLTARELALLTLGVCIALLIAIPFVLHYLGTTWQPGIRRRSEALATSGPTGPRGNSRGAPPALQAASTSSQVADVSAAPTQK